MDPVAGAFQDYGDDGFYKDQWRGMDSLHEFYKEDYGTQQNVKAESWQDRQTLTWPLVLPAGAQTVKVTYTNHFWEPHDDGRMYLDRLVVLDSQGRQVRSVEFEDLGAPVRPWIGCGATIRADAGTGRDDSLELWNGYNDCALSIDIEVPALDVYTVEVVAWSNGHDERYGHDGYARLGVIANGYEVGDTWYRAMRVPGFSAEQAPEGEDSMQWLARQIVDDRRFAEAAVKFWWPAIMGRDVAEPPAEEGDSDFEGQLLAANAQSAELRRLAHGFRQGFHGGSAYNLKDLLVEIVLSKWFRADALSDADTVRWVALRDAGARRLLTPEELARKTAALTGYQWGREFDNRETYDVLNKLTGDFRLLYGGIDSDGITERARNITSVMAGVAKRHAVRTSCRVVLRELFLLPDEGRILFAGVDKNVTPATEFSDTFEITAASRSEMETLSLQGHLAAGEKTVRIAFLNDYWHETRGDRNVLLDRLTVRQGSTVVHQYEMENLDHRPRCHHMEQDAFHLSGSGTECVLAVPVDIPSNGTYQIEIAAWATHAGDELPKLSVAVESDAEDAGAATIRDKLVELHEKLLGVEVTPHSPDVDIAFSLFVDVMERGQSLDTRFQSWQCRPDDRHFFDGILDDILIEIRDEWGHLNGFDFDWDRVDALWESTDFSDVHYIARAWGVVLAYLMTDYRYLQL